MSKLLWVSVRPGSQSLWAQTAQRAAKKAERSGVCTDGASMNMTKLVQIRINIVKSLRTCGIRVTGTMRLEDGRQESPSRTGDGYQPQKGQLRLSLASVNAPTLSSPN